MFGTVKTYIYGAVIASVVIAGGLFLEYWHYGPKRESTEKIESLEEQLRITGEALNTCEANLTKQQLQGYIDGIGENDEIPVIGLDDLHT